MKEAQEKSRAGGKKSGGPTLLFEAEATSWLAKNGVPTTNDSAKYVPGSVPKAGGLPKICTRTQIGA